MNTYLFTAPKFQPLDATGALMPASYVQFYLSGTTTPTDVFADGDLNTPLANPVVSDSDGVFPFIYMNPDVTYRAQFYNAADELQWDVDPYTPPRDYAPGTVLMFMGTAEQLEAAYPSALWQVCDGTNGTYDLRGRLPIGVSSTIDPGEEVGSVPGSVNTSAAGAHDHGGVTGASTAPLPAHSHFAVVDDPSSSTPVSASLSTTRENNFTGGDTQYILRGTAATPTLSPTSSSGAGGTHTHTVPEQAAHIHVVDTVLPPATGVWFVMRKFP